MPMMRFPGTVSRPAETMVRQMEWISTRFDQQESRIREEEAYSRSISLPDLSKYCQ